MARLTGDRLVTLAKITRYLLDPQHPIGASKAAFFGRFGFSTADPAALLEALSTHPDDNELIAVEHGRYGTKSIVQCRLVTPDGRAPCVRTVWMLDAGSSAHRFVTAYPAGS